MSNVVNGNPKVGTETRHKVLAAIESVGYQASRAARSLRSGRTYLPATGWAANPTLALDVFLHHMVATAVDADLEVVLLSERDGDPVEPYRAMVQRGGADGFILEGVSYDDPRIPFLEAQGIPFACFGRVDGREDIPWVDIDGAGGTSTAVRHVLVGVPERRLRRLGDRRPRRRRARARLPLSDRGLSRRRGHRPPHRRHARGRPAARAGAR